MSPYLLAGPAVALIGIVAVMFVMRHRSTDKRSMYSSRRSRMEHKVKAARSRTLAPHGRSGHAPTADEIATAAHGWLSTVEVRRVLALVVPADAPTVVNSDLEASTNWERIYADSDGSIWVPTGVARTVG